MLNEQQQKMCTQSQWDAGCRFDFPNPEHR